MQTIVHLVDGDLPRGAQRGAQMLVDALDGDERHLLATIFDSPPAVLRPDVSLGVRDGRWRSAGWSHGAVRAIRSSEELRDADLVIAHGGEALKYLAAASTPGKLIYHKIGILGRGFRRPTSARLHRWAVRQADAVVAISEQARVEATDASGAAANRVTIIPNARDPEHFIVPTRQRNAPVRLAWVGHMSRTKRPGLFLDIVEELRWRGHLFDAVMAGAGPALESVRRRAAPLDVEILGPVDDIASLLGESDIFLFTSIPEGEGMPGVLIEASMCGSVPVSTKVPGAADVVIDTRTGAIVDPHDVEQLYAATERYLTDPIMLGEHAAAGRRHVAAQFSTDRVAADWRKLCVGMLEETSCVSST